MKKYDRMPWIEACLRYFDHFPKAAYREKFNISEATVSADIREFVSFFSDLECDIRIVAGKIAGRLPDTHMFDLPDPVEVLRAMRVVPLSSVETLVRAPTDPQALTGVVRSIREKKPIILNYFSSGKGPTRRIISMNRIVDAAGRLHARGYDHDRNEYRDFVIGRITEVTGFSDEISYVDAMRDSESNEHMTIVLDVNPALSPEARALAQREYRVSEGGNRKTIRKSDLFYVKAVLGETSPGWLPPIILKRTIK